MKVKPLFDKVVVESLETEEKTSSGFILPSASQEKQQMAKIVAVGPGGIIDGNHPFTEKILKHRAHGGQFSRFCSFVTR